MDTAMKSNLTWLAVAVIAWSALVVAQDITPDQIRDGLKNPTRWLTYSGDYGGTRHSPLTQITPANVNQLTAQWTFQTGVLGKFEATPIVIDGIDL